MTQSFVLACVRGRRCVYGDVSLQILSLFGLWPVGQGFSIVARLANTNEQAFGRGYCCVYLSNSEWTAKIGFSTNFGGRFS